MLTSSEKKLLVWFLNEIERENGPDYFIKPTEIYYGVKRFTESEIIKSHKIYLILRRLIEYGMLKHYEKRKIRYNLWGVRRIRRFHKTKLGKEMMEDWKLNAYSFTETGLNRAKLLKNTS